MTQPATTATHPNPPPPNWVPKWLVVFLQALQHETSLPLPAWVAPPKPGTPAHRHATVLRPLVGWLIGGVAALGLVLGTTLANSVVGLALALVLPQLVTGGRHARLLLNQPAGALVSLLLGVPLVIALLVLPHSLLPWVLVAGHSLSRAALALQVLLATRAPSANEGLDGGVSISGVGAVLLLGLLPLEALPWSAALAGLGAVVLVGVASHKLLGPRLGKPQAGAGTTPHGQAATLLSTEAAFYAALIALYMQGGLAEDWQPFFL